MTDFTEDIQKYLKMVQEILGKISVQEVNAVMNCLNNARLEGKSVFIMGNGGSAATASHFVCDFNKGISEYLEQRFKFMCLNDNIPTMMAYANDTGYENIFVGPLRNFLTRGDVVIGLSGSGNSPNVIKAIEYANENQAITVGFTGYDGGKLKKLSQMGVHVPIDHMQVVEDLHMILDHLMMTVFSQVLRFPKSK